MTRFKFSDVRLGLLLAGLVGMTVLVLVQLALGGYRAFSWLRWNEHIQMLLLIASMALFVMGISGARLHRPAWGARQMIASLLVTLFALAVRVGPPGTTIRVLVDELQTVGQVLILWSGDSALLSKISSSLMPYPLVFGYFTNASSALLGTNMVGLRGATLLAGALTVTATYFLALTLTDDRLTALLAGLALAALPVAVHFSRIAPINSFDPLVGTLALVFLARGWKHNTPLDWALGGLMLGLTFLFWEGGRLFFTPLALLWLAWSALFDWQTAKTRWHGLLIAVIALALIVIPLQVTWHYTSSHVTGRITASGLNRAVFLDILTSDAGDVAFQNYMLGFVRAYGLLFALPESSIFYGGDTALLLWWVVPFALAGIVVTLRGFTRYTVLPLMWALAVPAANGLLLASTNGSPRYIIVFPALALLVAYGVRAVTRLLPRYPQAAAYALMAALIVGQIGYYYGVHLPAYNQFIRQQPDIDDAMLRAATLPTDHTVFVVYDSFPQSDQSYPISLIRYLTKEDPPPVQVHPAEAFLGEVITGPLPPKPVFIIEQGDEASYAAIQEAVGSVSCTLSPHPVPVEKQYRLCQ